jgi:hypothetical protein
LTVGAHVLSHKTKTKRFQNLCGETKCSEELNFRYYNCNTTVLKTKGSKFRFWQGELRSELNDCSTLFVLHYFTLNLYLINLSVITHSFNSKLWTSISYCALHALNCPSIFFLMFCWPSIVIYPCNMNQQDAQFSTNLFQ